MPAAFRPLDAAARNGTARHGSLDKRARLLDIRSRQAILSAPTMPLSPAELERLRPVLERLVAALRPEEIWLFGSRAENRARPKSDYDLLAVLPDDTPEAELDPIRAWSLVRGLGVPVDIMPCTRSEFEEEKHEIDTLARAAFLRGTRLYERAA